MAASKIKTYDPRIQVTLKKNIRREFIAGGDGLGGAIPASGRFKSADRVIDLTRYLGDSGGVKVSKSVRSPAGGFNIVLADQMFSGKGLSQMESLYGLIEPMDMIEIRWTRNPALYRGSNLPIIMRGFVSNVGRSHVMGNDGRPQRSITISGQDYGKIWQNILIKYWSNFVMGQDVLSILKFAQNYGVNSDRYFTPNEFVYEVIQKVFNGFTKSMRRDGSTDGPEDKTSPVKDINIFDLTVPTGKISPYGVNTWEGGNLYTMLEYYCDVGAWNELFIEDREDGPAIVYRPNPFKTPDGKFIQTPSSPYKASSGTVDSAGVRVINIDDSDIISENTSRSDQNLANYFWVDNPSYNVIDETLLKIEGAQQRPDSYFLKDYRNCAPWLYGIRPMQAQTQQVVRIDGKSEAKLQTGRGEYIEWIDGRRAILAENNRDNVIFESGTMNIKGDEHIKAGSYLQVTRGNMVFQYYVPSVDISFMPFKSFTATVMLERGTGFIARAQREREKQSPYLAEANNSGVYD